MIAALDAAGIEIVCLAGYMRLLTPRMVTRFAGRMLNIHPSLLPAFPGLDTHARALAAGVKLHGCTVHLVTEAMDDGPILAQAAVPVLPGDTEASARRAGAGAGAPPLSARPRPPRARRAGHCGRGGGTGRGGGAAKPLAASRPPPVRNPPLHPDLHRGAPMAETYSSTPAPVTEDAFLADRQQFWISFGHFTLGGTILVVVILVLMALFLV